MYCPDRNLYILTVIQVQYCGAADQDVLHIDERRVMIRSKGMFDKPSPTTEGVVTDVQKRPMTSISRS